MRRLLERTLLLLLLTLSSLVSTGHLAHGDEVVPRVTEDPSPLAGMPGLLDTHVVARGRCVASFPILSLDCGVTDGISIGAVGSLLLPNISGVPSVNLRLRARIYATPRLVTTLDVAGGGLGVDEARLLAGYLASNTSLRLSARHTLNLTVAAVGLTVEHGDLEMSSLAMGSLVAALTHEAAITPRLSTSVSVGSVPVISGHSDLPGSTFLLDRGLSAGLLERTFVRAVVAWRFTPAAALSAGAWWSPAFEAPLPSVALDVVL